MISSSHKVVMLSDIMATADCTRFHTPRKNCLREQ